MGKGKDSNSESSERTAAPLSSLKNPASFGPPPKHSGYHGGAAASNETSRDRSSLRAPVSEEQGYQQDMRQYPQQQYPQHRQAEVEAQEPEEEERPPPTPFRVDTTGLKTDHLPPPPRRTGSSSASSVSSSKPSAKPGVPPRVPPRTNSTPSQQEPFPPPAYSPIPRPSEQASEGYINQGATSRLANAGVSVPGLEIGHSHHGGYDRGESAPNTASPATGQAPANSLQGRFAQTRTRPAPPPPPHRAGSSSVAQGSRDEPSPASSGGVRASMNNFREQHSDKIDAGKQKMSGLSQRFNSSSSPAQDSHQTSSSGGVRSSVSNFREQHSDKIDAGKQKMSGLSQRFNGSGSTSAQDPHEGQAQSGGVRSSVSNFREQHSDKIDAGKQKMSGLSHRVNNYVDGQKSLPSGQRPPASSSPSAPSSNVAAEAASRKKPPPPPPKRAEIRASSVAPPPPLPLNTKPH